jgi:hypothetical protein
MLHVITSLRHTHSVPLHVLTHLNKIRHFTYTLCYKFYETSQIYFYIHTQRQILCNFTYMYTLSATSKMQSTYIICYISLPVHGFISANTYYSTWSVSPKSLLFRLSTCICYICSLTLQIYTFIHLYIMLQLCYLTDVVLHKILFELFIPLLFFMYICLSPGTCLHLQSAYTVPFPLKIYVYILHCNTYSAT